MVAIICRISRQYIISVSVIFIYIILLKKYILRNTSGFSMPFRLKNLYRKFACGSFAEGKTKTIPNSHTSQVPQNALVHVHLLSFNKCDSDYSFKKHRCRKSEIQQQSNLSLQTLSTFYIFYFLVQNANVLAFSVPGCREIPFLSILIYILTLRNRSQYLNEQESTKRPKS